MLFLKNILSIALILEYSIKCNFKLEHFQEDIDDSQVKTNL